jgi:hypothetical protein
MPKQRPLEVYGWMGFVRWPGGSTQCRVIVAAASFAAAMRAVEAAGLQKPGRDFVSTSGNSHDLETGLAAPGTVFACEDPYRPHATREYRPVAAGRAE